MGCDIYFYLLAAEKYIKQLRPKFIEYYGPINYERAIEDEKQKVQLAGLMKSIGSGSFILKRFSQNYNREGPLKKNMVREGSESQQLYDEIDEYIEKNATEVVESIRHQFLRHDGYLQEIDSFQEMGVKIKVSNIIQVENYINYIKFIKKTLEKDPQCQFSDIYDDMDQVQEIFEEVMKQMKESKEECYFIMRHSN